MLYIIELGKNLRGKSANILEEATVGLKPCKAPPPKKKIMQNLADKFYTNCAIVYKGVIVINNLI